MTNIHNFQTFHLGGDLYVKPTLCAGNEIIWLLFNEGITCPLAVMTNFQLTRLKEAFERINETESSTRS